MTENKLRGVVAKLEVGKTKAGENIAESSKIDLKSILKNFYKALNKGKHPSYTDFIKITLKNNKRKLPDDLLSPEEVEQMITAAKNTRDKALISFLHESGARIGELAAIQVKHVMFDENGVVCTIPQGKTGARRIRLVGCERHLRNWLLDHPNKDNPESPLWVELTKESDRMNYSAMSTMLRKKARLAGIKKRIHPHLFRHSRATELAKVLTEQQMKNYLGWTQASDMAAVYVHLSGKDLDEAILRANGVIVNNKPKESIRCQSCGKINPSASDYCGACFRPLKVEIALEVDRKTKYAREDLRKLIADVIKQEISMADVEHLARKLKNDA